MFKFCAVSYVIVFCCYVLSIYILYVRAYHGGGMGYQAYSLWKLSFRSTCIIDKYGTYCELAIKLLSYHLKVNGAAINFQENLTASYISGMLGKMFRFDRFNATACF